MDEFDMDGVYLDSTANPGCAIWATAAVTSGVTAGTNLHF